MNSSTDKDTFVLGIQFLMMYLLDRLEIVIHNMDSIGYHYTSMGLFLRIIFLTGGMPGGRGRMGSGT